MTNLDLFIALGSIRLENLSGAEALQYKPDIRINRRRHRQRAALIAAVLAALLLLVGCGYAMLSGAAWFQSYFAQQKGQPLSQGQTDYIARNTMKIGQSASVNGYTVTVESAIAEARTAYIKLRLEGPKPFKKWVSFKTRWTSDDRLEASFYQKGSSAQTQSPYGNGYWTYDDPVGNVLSVLIKFDQSGDPAAPSFEAGSTYILHLTDLTENDWGEPGDVVAEGEWNFEIIFDHLNDTEVELVSQPVMLHANGASLNLTSLKLRTMGIEAAFNSADPEDMHAMAVFSLAKVVLKDGTFLFAHPSSFDPSGSAGLSLDCPIDPEEVDYIAFQDGTTLPMP